MTNSLPAKPSVSPIGMPPPGLARAIREREVARLERAELVRRGAAGDALAYERLFGWLWPQIVRYAAQRTLRTKPVKPSR